VRDLTVKANLQGEPTTPGYTSCMPE